jgi:hypothetical protein
LFLFCFFTHTQGDIVLVGLRDYQDEKADVIMKYTADEARVLKQVSGGSGVILCWQACNIYSEVLHPSMLHTTSCCQAAVVIFLQDYEGSFQPANQLKGVVGSNTDTAAAST